MGIKIKNLQTGEFEKFNIPALKGEKGEPGEIEPSEKVDYIGKQHSKLRDTMNANVDYIIKTAIGEFNYLDYDGQHITALDTLEGQAKSAILSGQTLVNLIKFKSCSSFISYNNGTAIFTNPTGAGNLSFSAEMFKPSTKYIFRANFKCDSDWIITIRMDLFPDTYEEFKGFKPTPTPTNYYFTFTTPSDISTLESFRIYVPTSGSGTATISDIMILEYQEGIENWDIPYFEGMQSVKMPVLTTYNSNIFPFKEFIEGTGATEDKDYIYIDGTFNKFTIPLETDGNIYTLYVDGEIISHDNFGVWGFIHEDGTIRGSYLKPESKTFDTLNKKLVGLEVGNPFGGRYKLKKSLLCLNLKSIGQQPYKSNILTVNEEVELRGIGDVRDELNLLTGEIKERVGEVVLDGSEDWSWGINDDGGYRFDLVIPTMHKYPSSGGNPVGEMLSNYLPVGGFTVSKTYDKLITTWENRIVLYLGMDITTTKELKEYLSQNPLTVQYKLATESIKTVDLSDNHVYSYKDVTHYDCSSAEGSLVPTLSVKVPTDTQLTIQEQKATTQTLLIKNMDLQQSIKEVQAMNLAFNTVLYNSFNSIREEVEDIKKYVSTNENLEGSF